jgi:alkaline phosphatase
MKNGIIQAALALGLSLASLASLTAAPRISRLNPPSDLFSFGDPNPPIIARFLPGQRFDLNATIIPDAGQRIAGVKFYVDDVPVNGNITLVLADVSTLATVANVVASPTPAGTTVAFQRAYANSVTGVHRLTVSATQLPDGQSATATGNFEIVNLGTAANGKARNIIVMIGDGMGIAHRTAGRIMGIGVSQGKSLGSLNMDTFPVTGIVKTASLNSIVTDSAPGATCYSSGNKNNNNQMNVFPDDTASAFDNPRIESMGEYFTRTSGKSLGIVTTADVFDATPAAFASHTALRSAGTGICDRYLDEFVGSANLTVLLGGGRKWFLPNTTIGSGRTSGTSGVITDELAAGWSVPKGGPVNLGRDLIGDFKTAGFTYVSNFTEMQAVPTSTTKLLGLFTYSNMNVAMDKVFGRRKISTIVNDYGFPDQPMLEEMTGAALNVLNKNPNGFVLMVEAASIDKQAHLMDTDRWIMEVLEFDRAIGLAKSFAAQVQDTLIIITADHECGGVNIIGASVATTATLAAGQNGSVATLRDNLVGTYDLAGFPNYRVLSDGYPATPNPDFKMLIGYASGADRYEGWFSNPKPTQDSQQPLVNQAPLNTYPLNANVRNQFAGYFVSGQVPADQATHTASDIPLSAYGRGAVAFVGVQDNTDVFFKMMKAALVGTDTTVSER